MNQQENIQDIILNSIEYPTIPENVFVEKYMPLLSELSPHEFNLKWINEVSMGVYNSVDIVKINGDGSETKLHRLPPIAGRYNTEINSGIGGLLSFVESVKNSGNDLMAEKTLQLAFDKLNPNLGASEQQVNDWIRILEYYGVKSSNKGTNEASNEQLAQLYSSDEEDWG